MRSIFFNKNYWEQNLGENPQCLAFISIYVENYLFLMRVDVLRANPHKIDALFALLSKTKLYTHFGNQLQQMIEKVKNLM